MAQAANGAEESKVKKSIEIRRSVTKSGASKRSDLKSSSSKRSQARAKAMNDSPIEKFTIDQDNKDNDDSGRLKEVAGKRGDYPAVFDTPEKVHSGAEQMIQPPQNDSSPEAMESFKM